MDIATICQRQIVTIEGQPRPVLLPRGMLGMH